MDFAALGARPEQTREAIIHHGDDRAAEPVQVQGPPALGEEPRAHVPPPRVPRARQLPGIKSRAVPRNAGEARPKEDLRARAFQPCPATEWPGLLQALYFTLLVLLSGGCSLSPWPCLPAIPCIPRVRDLQTLKFFCQQEAVRGDVKSTT